MCQVVSAHSFPCVAGTNGYVVSVRMMRRVGLRSHVRVCDVQKRDYKFFYRRSRWKSITVDRKHYNRAWTLRAGNSYDLFEKNGHELESFENFGVYRYDARVQKGNVPVGNEKVLPPLARLDALFQRMRRQSAMNNRLAQMKTALDALECFEDNALAAKGVPFTSLTEEQKMYYRDCFETVLASAERCIHVHPDAVAGMIRAATVADACGDAKRRVHALARAKSAATRLGERRCEHRPAESLLLRDERNNIGDLKVVHERERNRLSPGSVQYFPRPTVTYEYFETRAKGLDLPPHRDYPAKPWERSWPGRRSVKLRP